MKDVGPLYTLDAQHDTSDSERIRKSRTQTGSATCRVDGNVRKRDVFVLFMSVKATSLKNLWHVPLVGGAATHRTYGRFSKFHVCFCGLDPGNLKFETVRTNKQHLFLGFETLNLKFCDLKL